MFLTESPLFMTKSESLLSLFSHSLFFKVRPWENRSVCSEQKSDCERVAKVAHNKRVTVSDSLKKNRSESHFCSQKTSD